MHIGAEQPSKVELDENDILLPLFGQLALDNAVKIALDERMAVHAESSRICSQIAAVLHSGASDELLGSVVRRVMKSRARQAADRIEAAAQDAAALDWIERQHLEELGMGLVIDAPGDGRYYVCGDSGVPHYGKTLRDALSRALAAET